jgi:cell division protein YceG involved in septum cleavage
MGRSEESDTVIRLDRETVRAVKVAAAKSGETMKAWLRVASLQRLEREGRTVGDTRRVASVTFKE